MRHSIATILVLLATMHPLVAQQRESNSPGASFTSGGIAPTPGLPFQVNSQGNISFEIGGTAHQPFTLFLGDLASSSLQVPILANQFFDLDLGNVLVVGDGFGGPAALPRFLFQLNGAGSSAFSFPVNPSVTGAHFAFQAVVRDVAIAPLGLNLSAAAEFRVTSGLAFGGDQFQNYMFPSGGYAIFGTTYTNIDVSTNGWIRFGGGSSSSDILSSRAAFVAGTTGGGVPAPIIAPYWSWLNLGSGVVTVDEVAPGVTEVHWQNFSQALAATATGSMKCTINVSNLGPVITFDYTGFAPGTTAGGLPGLPLDEIVGISDGGLASALVNEVNLIQTGAVVPVAAATGPQMIFQSFLGTGTVPAEVNDLAGHVLVFSDPAGIGAFQML